jgi:hypothetical protein
MNLYFHIAMFHISKKYKVSSYTRTKRYVRKYSVLCKKLHKRIKPLNQHERTNAMYEKYRIVPLDGKSSHLEKFIVTALNICIYKQIHNL